VKYYQGTGSDTIARAIFEFRTKTAARRGAMDDLSHGVVPGGAVQYSMALLYGGPNCAVAGGVIARAAPSAAVGR